MFFLWFLPHFPVSSVSLIFIIRLISLERLIVISKFSILYFIQAICWKNGKIISYHSSCLSYHFLPKYDYFNFILVGVSIIIFRAYSVNHGFPGVSGKEFPCQRRRCRRCGLGPLVRKIPGERNGNLVQYSCLENVKDRGACQTTVHKVIKNWTWLSDCEPRHGSHGAVKT